MAEKTLHTVIQVRRDTTENWLTNKDVIPAAGEPCMDLDTGVVRWGNGVDTYENLPLSGGTANHYEGWKQDDETALECIDRISVTNDIDAEKGDMFVVSSIIPGNKISKEVYYCTGTAWNPMDANYRADNVFFPDNLVMTCAFGKYEPVDGKVIVPSRGLSVAELFEDAFATDQIPTIVQPSVTLTSSQMKAYEVGTEVTPAYTATLKTGSYEFGPATGVTAESWVVTNTDGDELTTATGTFDAITVADDTSYSITAEATYADGAMPITALENDYADGKILAGTKSYTKGTITGYRNTFYGTAEEKGSVVDSDAVRALAGKTGKALANNGKFTVTVPVGAIRVVFAYPATLRDVSSVKDVNGMNAEIKGAFVQTAVDVEGANGHEAIPYKVYTYDLASAVGTANTFAVTI